MVDLLNIHCKEFPSNICEAFKAIKNEKDLHDVTLVCDDGDVDAHKLILYSGSSFFQSVLKKSQHQHPLIYMKGLKIKHLHAILDFLYNGEVNVAQDDLTEFIEAVEDLKIKGLITERQTDKLCFEGGIEKDHDKAMPQLEKLVNFNAAEPEIVMLEPKEEIMELTEPVLITIDIKEDIKEENLVKDLEKKNFGRNENNKNKFLQHANEKDIIKSAKERTLINDIRLDTNTIKDISGEHVIKVGATFASREEVQNAVEQFSDSNFSPFVIFSCSIKKHLKFPTRKLVYKCPYGILKKSKSEGKTTKQSKYVGCPAVLHIFQQANGAFIVRRAEVEHKEHDVGEESYAKIKKKLSKDQKEAVKAFLETKPSNYEVSLFLIDLTGKQYSREDAGVVRRRLLKEEQKIVG